MANVDWATKIKSVPFGNLLNAGNLGATSTSNSPASLTPSASFQVPPGVSPDLAFALQWGKPTPAELDAQSERELNRNLRLLTEQDILARSQADYRQKLGKESTAEAFKYKMLQQGIDKIGNAFNPYGSREGALAYAAHLSSIPGNVSEQMRSMNMQPPAAMSYNAPQKQYFT
jgi:hypothetical protein